MIRLKHLRWFHGGEPPHTDGNLAAFSHFSIKYTLIYYPIFPRISSKLPLSPGILYALTSTSRRKVFPFYASA